MLIRPAMLLILYSSRSSSIIYTNAACMYYENFSQVPSWESSKAVDLLLLIFTIMLLLHCYYIIINVLLMFSLFTLLLHIIIDLLFIIRSLLDIIMSLLCLYYNIFRNGESFTSPPIIAYCAMIVLTLLLIITHYDLIITRGPILTHLNPPTTDSGRPCCKIRLTQKRPERRLRVMKS